MLTGRQSLEEFLIDERKRHTGASGSLNAVILAAARACKLIAHQVAAGRLSGPAGPASTDDNPGRIAELAEEVFTRMMRSSGHLAGLLSAGTDTPIALDKQGKYLLLVEPLDGAPNLELNVAAGSIFSVLRAGSAEQDPAIEDFLQPGQEQVCAGYAIYGPATLLVLTVGTGVHGFTLDPTLGEFVLTHPGLRVVEETSVFAINAVNRRLWEPAVRRYVDECAAGESGPRNRDFSMRWFASQAAETHRILMRGGVFLNPRDPDQSASGQARLLYDANPIAFIIEQAGGRATTGHRPILGIAPQALHQEVALIFGSRVEVERIERYHEETTEDYDAPLFGVRGLFRT
jgi:fructose-1,6-bisphosphatase I/sedoheptulose-1,7-bisphosphatase